MYLYFDREGTLKEIVRDDATRQGNEDINKIFVYWDDAPYNSITSGWIRYRLPNGEISPDPETSIGYVFNIPVFTPENMTEIPFNDKRDLKYFKYFRKYKMFTINVPSVIFENAGTVGATIKFVTGNPDIEEDEEGNIISISGGTITSMGLVTFEVEAGIEKVDTGDCINQSQWNYILKVLRQNNVTAVAGLSDLDLTNYGVNALLFNVLDNKIYRVIEDEDGLLTTTNWFVLTGDITYEVI